MRPDADLLSLVLRLLLVSVVALALLPLDVLGQIGLALLVWGAISTLLVGALGAWVAAARNHRGRLHHAAH